MKNGWKRYTFGELGRIFNGNSISESEKKAHFEGLAEGVPYIGTKDVRFDLKIDYESGVKIPDNKRDGFKLAPADTVLVCAEGGSAGRKIAHTDRDVYFGNKLFAIAPTPQNSNRLVFYYCLSDAFAKQFKGAMAGLIGGVSLNKFKDLAITIPPLPEQKRIVGILNEAFEGIATAKANAEKNLQNARALFESHLQSVFAKAWQTSKLVTLSELATDITDGDHLPPPKAPTGVPFITIGNIVKDTRKIDFSDTFMVLRTYFDKLKENKKPRKGDVLYTVTGSFGIPVIVDNDAEFCFQRHIGLIRPKAETNSSWLYYLLLSPQVFQQANEQATGTAQKTVSLKVLRGFQVPSVPLPQQRDAVAKLDMLSVETHRLETIYQQKLDALESLKKSLLNQAFTGEL